MIYKVSTTGSVSQIELIDLGYRLLVHPVVSLDLGLEYSECELTESHNLQTAIDNEELIVIEKSGDSLTLPEVITVASGIAEYEIADHAYSKIDLNAGQLDTRYYTETEINTISGTLDKEIIELEEILTLTSGSIVKNHGGLTGLSNDDHPQYFNEDRGDARYYTHTQLDTGQLDNRYYTESEVNSISGTLSNAIATHKSSSDHDSRYYTKPQVDTISGSLNSKIITNHSGLTGLSNDDHTQYVLANGLRGFTSTISGITPTVATHLTTKNYVDTGFTSVSGFIIKAHSGLTGLSNDDHSQYHNDTRGDIRYYTKSQIDTIVSGSGSNIAVKDEGTALSGTPHSTLNFVGAGVIATSTTSGIATITIPGSVTISDEGVNLVDTPHSKINFSGALVTATNAGGGVANISMASPIFGSAFSYAYNESESTTGSTVPVTKLSLVSNVEAGTYRIGWYYEWKRDVTTSWYRGDVIIVNTSTIISEIYTRTSNTSNYYTESGYYISAFNAGEHTISIRFYGSSSSNTSYIRRARLELWRVA